MAPRRVSARGHDTKETTPPVHKERSEAQPAFTGEINDAAEIFPLMGGDDLEALAADIKQNGLRQPLVLNANGELLDGRNRLRACELAGVTPEFVTMDGDPVAIVVSLNVKRRNLTAGQRAIAAAEAWDMFADSRAERRAIKLGTLFGSNKVYVDKARALVERDPDAAAAVKANTLALNDAYQSLLKREEDLQERTHKVETLRSRRPDLAERIDGGGITTEEAFTLMREDEARERQQRETMVQNITHALLILTREPNVAIGLVDELDANEHDFNWSADDCIRASAFLSALAERLQTKEAK
jgi:ParB-like chromosome segregation protein Spo0J